MTMKKLLFMLSVTAATTVCGGNAKQASNFTTYTNVSPQDVVSRYKENTVVFYRNDSCFTANINEDGELQNIVYTKDLKKLGAEGQIAYEKSGKIYYSKSGKLFVSEKKENGKWSYGKPVVIKGSEVTRDKYRGSVLAYANWRYMPNDSIVILNPCINEEGNTLYFASNMNDSKGLDIWYVEKNEDGEWSYPHKMGREVNSSADEDFPFIREDGKITFASNRKNPTFTPDSSKYNIYLYNPGKGGSPLLLANVLDESLRQPELNVEKGIKEPTNDSLLADNGLINDSLLANNNTANKNGNDGTIVDLNGNAAAPSSPMGTDISNKENDLATTDILGKKTENEKILDLLSDSTANKATDANKVSAKDLDEAFQLNPDSILRVSQNVIATTDRRIFYFDYDKDILNGDYVNDIEVLLEFINFYPKSSFLIIGHTDERGSFEYNDALSIKRAKKIQSLLINKGVAKNRIYVMGLGEYKPVIKNAETEAEHQKNRRVEIQRMD